MPLLSLLKMQMQGKGSLLFQEVAGYCLPGHLLIHVLLADLDEVVILDGVPNLMVGLIAAAAWGRGLIRC